MVTCRGVVVVGFVEVAVVVVVVVVERVADGPPPQAGIEMPTSTRTAPSPKYCRIARFPIFQRYGNHQTADRAFGPQFEEPVHGCDSVRRREQGMVRPRGSRRAPDTRSRTQDQD